jgi:hypothetical protein
MDKSAALFSSVTDWQRKTFTQATPLSALKHLQREVAEAIKEIEGGGTTYDVLVELSDIQILLWGVVYMYLKENPTPGSIPSREYHEFIKAIEHKFYQIQFRKWGEPDGDGVVEHVKNATSIPLEDGSNPPHQLVIGGEIYTHKGKIYDEEATD